MAARCRPPWGAVRPDVVRGDDDGASREPGFVQRTAETLRGCGSSCRSTCHSAASIWPRPIPTRPPCLQIEINGRLYMDEDSRERSAGFGALRGDLEAPCPGTDSQAIARSPFAFTRFSSFSDGPSGRFSPRSHLLTASFRTFR